MRFLCVITALIALASGSAALLTDEDADIVLVIDASGMSAEQAGDEPWLAAPCIAPGHCYLRPVRVAKTGETYPVSDGDGYLPQEYSFYRAFLFERAARGFRPWEEHFMRLEDGGFMRVTDGGDCIYARERRIEGAAALVGALMKRMPKCRVALCIAGERFDERFSMNFTRDAEKLENALFAVPACVKADFGTAVNKAGEYAKRRTGDERRAREVVVIFVTEDENAALRAGDGALTFNALFEDAEAFVKRVFPRWRWLRAAVRLPLPICRERVSQG